MENLAKKLTITQGIGPLDSEDRKMQEMKVIWSPLTVFSAKMRDFAVDFAVYVYCMLKDDEVMKTRLVVSCFVSEGSMTWLFFSDRSGSTLGSIFL